MADSDEQFVSDPLIPAPGSFDASAMARGEPGLPAQFTWRGQMYQVDEVLEQWTSSTPEGGSGELYLRRHWWQLRTSSGHVMKIYCQRQAKNKTDRKQRWFVYTVRAPR